MTKPLREDLGLADKLKVHILKKGETLDKIAKKYGIKSGRLLFDAKANAKLKKERKDPKNLLPGDKIVIPAPDLKSIKLQFKKDMPRMSIAVDGKKQLVFVQQKWEYIFNEASGVSKWQPKEKKNFHNKVDKAIWAKWSGRYQLAVGGTSDFAKALKGKIFKVSFDIKYVKSGGHWKVTVTKIPKGGFKTSKVNWGTQTIQLDTEDVKPLEREDKDGGKHKQTPAAHEFGHAVGNSKFGGAMHGDEYPEASTYKEEYSSMLNIGSQLKKRHADHLVSELNKMIPNTTFVVKSVN